MMHAATALLDDPIVEEGHSVSASWSARKPWLVSLGRGPFKERAARRAADEIDLTVDLYLRAVERRRELEPLAAAAPLVRPTWTDTKRLLLQAERTAWDQAKEDLRRAKDDASRQGFLRTAWSILRGTSPLIDAYRAEREAKRAYKAQYHYLTWTTIGRRDVNQTLVDRTQAYQIGKKAKRELARVRPEARISELKLYSLRGVALAAAQARGVGPEALTMWREVAVKASGALGVPPDPAVRVELRQHHYELQETVGRRPAIGRAVDGGVSSRDPHHRSPAPKRPPRHGFAR